MKWSLRWLACWLCLLSSTSLSAHELRTGFLFLQQQGDSQNFSQNFSQDFDVSWKLPARLLGQGLPVPAFPEDCELTQQGSDNRLIQRWQLHCQTPLAGRDIRLDALAEGLDSALLQIRYGDGRVISKFISAGQTRYRVSGQSSWQEVAGDYLLLGVEHILLGIDHILFVFLLLLYVDGFWRLLKTITAFTVAHSITLALASLGLIHVQQAPVEAFIALSIVFLASEIARRYLFDQPEQGLSARYPWLVVFLFGLVHGLGFAGALAEIGLPQDQLVSALLFFNIGIEVGQLLFVLTVSLLYRLLSQRLSSRSAQGLQLGAVYVVGGIAMYWLIERVSVAL